MADAWDIVNAVAEAVGAIGTTGALLAAVRVYRRQIEDQRQAKARRVTVEGKEDEPEPSSPSSLTTSIRC